MTEADVAIVGAGPTGTLLANLLGRRGHSVCLIEKQPAPYDLPRAVHIDGEAMRGLQAAGLADAARRDMHVNPGMLFKSPDGRVLVDWSRDPQVGPMGWHESYRCHQPALEAVLREGLTRYPCVDIRSGTAATGLEQDEAGVTITTEAGPVRARYAVGCDGAGSKVRDWFGSGLEDLGFRERWRVVDLRLAGTRGDLGGHTIQFCDPERPMTYVCGVGSRRRWEMRLDPGAPDGLDPASVWASLAPWVGPADAVLERVAVYTFRSRIARHWRAGRVLLAGDAAHQMPPFMGQGMCAGIRDAVNLAWKLAAVLRGAEARLLDSYESERAPHVRAFISRSVALGRLINQSAAGALPEGRMRSIWPDLGPGLGPRDGTGGALVPQLRAAPGAAEDKGGGEVYALVEHPVGLGVPEVTGATEWLRARGAFGVIVRPDFYALGGASDAGGLRRLLATHEDWIGALGAAG